MKTAAEVRIGQKEQELEAITREVDALVIQRKDLRRFLDIDAEKIELAKVRAEVAKIRQAVEQEMAILREATLADAARSTVEQQRRDAEVAKREQAVSDHERLMRESGDRQRTAWIGQDAELKRREREVVSATTRLTEQREQFAKDRATFVAGLKGLLSALGAS